MAAATDGSLQLGFGLGKYPNRNVMDGYAGISRGVEQVTVRASRRLAPEHEETVVGPIHYEVIEPLKSVRYVLEANDTQPIAFDWRFDAIVPAFMEERTHRRNGVRVASDLVRYHQTGLATGWVEIDGERTEISPEHWVSTRDHSWGTRFDVGLPQADIEAGRRVGRLVVPHDLEPDRHAPARRQPVRVAAALPDREGAGLPAQGRHGRGRAPRRPDGALDRPRARPGLRPGQPAPRRRHGRRHDGGRRDPHARDRGRVRARASISGPGCTSASTGTTTGNGAGTSSSRASGSRTVRKRPQHDGSTSSATRSSTWWTRSAEARATATASRSSPVATPSWAFPPTTPSCRPEMSRNSKVPHGILQASATTIG